MEKTEFPGIELTPVSTITAYPRMPITETMVKSYKTLGGIVYHVCIGLCRRDGLWYPLCADTRDFDLAWEVCQEVQEKLSAAKAAHRERDRALAHLRGVF